MEDELVLVLDHADATPSSTGRPALPFEIQRVCGSKDGEHLFLVRNPLSLQQTPVDLVDLASRVVDVAPDQRSLLKRIISGMQRKCSRKVISDVPYRSFP